MTERVLRTRTISLEDDSISTQRTPTSSRTTGQIDDLNNEQCMEWANSYEKKGSIIYSKNPLTGYIIKSNNVVHKNIAKICKDKYNIELIKPKYSSLDDFCKNVSDISEFEEWLADPSKSYNGTIKKISLIKNAPYVKMYISAFNLLKKKYKKTDTEIISLLPKIHILYDGKIDYLYEYYINNIKDDKEKEYIYSILFYYIQKYINNNYNKDFETNFVYKNLFEIIKEKTQELFYYIENVILISGTEDYTNIEIIKDNINKIVYINNFVKNIINVDNEKTYEEIVLIIKKSYDLCIDLLNLITKVDIKNNGTKKFELIEDPLIKILNKPEFEKINKENLEIPIQNYTDEYNIKYKEVKNKYDKELEKYKNGEISNPPLRPVIDMVMNGIHKKITIGLNIIPKQNYTDNEYEKIKEEYKKNEPLINEYKALIQKGLLDLTGKAPLIHNNKSREQFIKEDLFDENINDKMRCNDDTDVLFGDEFKNNDYPLSKLQLLVKLQIRNKETNQLLRTDCYYAPNIYNSLVSQANEKRVSFIDPITKVELTKEHIDIIMDTMRTIIPDIEVPRYLRAEYDTKLMIGYEIAEDYNRVKVPYYNVYVYRTFGIYNIKVYNICSIPIDIEPTIDPDTNQPVIETGSLDITSSTMIYNIMKLFEDGRLLSNYIAPYYITENINRRTYKTYIPLGIHFNNFKDYRMWMYKDDNTKRTRKELIKMFIHYCTEINNYI